MKIRSMTKGQAFIAGIFVLILLILGYSYYKYHSFIQGFYDFVGLFQNYPIQVGILLFGVLILGYFLGKAY